MNPRYRVEGWAPPEIVVEVVQCTRKFDKLVQTDDDNAVYLVIFMTQARARPSSLGGLV